MRKRGGQSMAERMLVTQALDERDLLAKKIRDKISGASFTDVKKHNEQKVWEQKILAKDFNQEAECAYQQIMDLIKRFHKIEAAIVASNAKAIIHTSFGDYTVAGAIALRGRMLDSKKLENQASTLKGKISESGKDENELDFERILYKKMKRELDERLLTVSMKNNQLESTAESMRLSILGKDSRVKEDKPLEVVNAYIKENTSELVDPLDVRKKVAELQEKREKLISELDTQIKVSNATTVIEI